MSLLELKGKIESQAQQERRTRSVSTTCASSSGDQQSSEGQGNEIADLRKRVEDAKSRSTWRPSPTRARSARAMGPQSPEYE